MVSTPTPKSLRIQDNHIESEDYRLCILKPFVKVFIPWSQWSRQDKWALSYLAFGRHKTVALRLVGGSEYWGSLFRIHSQPSEMGVYALGNMNHFGVSKE